MRNRNTFGLIFHRIECKNFIPFIQCANISLRRLLPRRIDLHPKKDNNSLLLSYARFSEFNNRNRNVAFPLNKCCVYSSNLYDKVAEKLVSEINPDGDKHETLKGEGKKSEEGEIPKKSSATTQKPVPSIEENKKRSLWNRVKDELRHYWHGSKLFAHETKISSKLLTKMIKGGSLIRRERIQLAKTTADMIRLVPFSIFVIVPFLEFLLPVFLRLFPNMLPSTFENLTQEEMKRKKAMKAKMESAKLIHELVEEMAMLRSSSSTNIPSRDTNHPVEDKTKEASGAVARTLSELFKEYRVTGQEISTPEFVKVAKSINPETFLLSTLPRKHLTILCKYMGLSTIGTNAILRFQITNKMRKLKADDQLIDEEGVDSLTPAELQSACLNRGIRISSSLSSNPSLQPSLPSSLSEDERAHIKAKEAASVERMKLELQQWLDLHLHHDLPPPLLILTRALIMANRRYEQDKEDSKEKAKEKEREKLSEAPENMNM